MEEELTTARASVSYDRKRSLISCSSDVRRRLRDEDDDEEEGEEEEEDRSAAEETTPLTTRLQSQQ